MKLAPFRIEVTAGGEPLRSPILRVEIGLAVDRPDRLEILTAPTAASSREVAGDGVVATLDGVILFSGRIDRSGLSLDSLHGRTGRLVAYSRYHRLRRGKLPQCWYQTTDSEAAERLASALELAPRVERTTRVHASLERHTDPLRFLRERAVECGFQLAVTGGRLYFSRELPALDSILCISRRGEILSLDVEERVGPSCALTGGQLEVELDSRFRPLTLLDLNGLDGRDGGLYRSVRVMHTIDSDGGRTRVEFVERGLDYALWRGRDPESEVFDLEK